ncbi:hypothetical protein PHYSODRAFT_499835 [Phytophthora sojae]|uniref:WRKY19-like zinc finger domain-containing protein n=1 Tax=Phytophthora sojae (strain P6497) TaxID=1094619 RepID=G4ZGR0_PHYSP|nr:hypothetical protein PHYSODRAFT_499835 [Phytophthora sojae]EGZ17559.1 hypothetical protein PHYSODRAFT_499835 [Phytophthora sojae]|eukprot:XP_009526617.1 hypothetical protein PHYSODRAFT_499835 [Phytophthora sojae]
MGLAEHMSENPDPVSCAGGTDEPRRLPALDDLRPPSSSAPPNPLAPLNHHNQVTRFMAKQALGYIPKLSVRSPERSTGVGSPSFRLPSLSGTPPLSPQKWAGPSPFSGQDDAQAGNDGSGRPSLPAFGQGAGNFIQRSGSFSESCASPIPPLKRQHQETPATTTTTHHPMSIADLCQPFRYMRAASCPWRPAIEPQTYMRTQSGCSDVDTLRGSLPLSGPPSMDDDFRRNRLERSSSMDAQTLMRGLKRPAAMPVDLTQWLDRPCRSSLSSLADSAADSAADSMHLLEQAGRSMRISDSPRADPIDASREAKREKKLCAFPQCTSNAVTRGLCISHGGGRRCQRKGCTRGAQSKGLCVAHGGGRICRAAGCSNIQRSMGLCIRHGGGRRCSVKGCQKGVCRVPDCTKHVKKKGLCRSHANSMYAMPLPGSS